MCGHGGRASGSSPRTAHRRVRGDAWAAALLLLLVVVATAVALPTAEAVCPGNGNMHVIYTTTNMGDNIMSFDTLGNYLGDVINRYSFPHDVVVDKLRAMVFGPGGHLYVTSARGTYSRIFAVSGNGLLNHTLNQNCSRNYLFTVAELDPKRNPHMDHPYGIAFHPLTDAIYVSNQNTVTVTKYDRVGPDVVVKRKDAQGEDGSPDGSLRWLPAESSAFALKAGDNESSADDPRSKAANDGLFASSWSPHYSMGSVRGLALSPPLPKSMVEGNVAPGFFQITEENPLKYYLVVCDLAQSRLRVFDAESGQHLFSIPAPTPVQVYFPSRYSATSTHIGRGNLTSGYFDRPFMYVTSKDEGTVSLVPLAAPAKNDVETTAHSIIKTRLGSASGIYENPSHDMLLVGDRSRHAVAIFASPFLSRDKSSSPYLGHFVKNIPDQPEFIVTTLVEHQKSIPFCYELQPDGQFRYVALCTAVYIWSVALGLFTAASIGAAVYKQMSRSRTRSLKHGRGHEMSSLADGENIPLTFAQEGVTYGTHQESGW